MVSRSKSWVFTINNYTREEEGDVKELPGVQYLVYGREVGESGTHHLQGYVYFKNARTLSSLKKKLPRAHLEVRRGTHEQARDYCQKDGDFFEVGIEPEKNGGDKLLEKIRKNRVLRDTPLNELVDTGLINIKEVRALKNSRMDLAQELGHYEAKGVRGVWYYGPPGVGKSHKARTENPNSYIKAQNKWFDGYAGEKTIILDDLDCKELGHYLKIWSDKWSCSGEVKGGKVPLVHDQFIVTSNFHPRELWEGHMLEAITRRFRIVHFDSRFQ